MKTKHKRIVAFTGAGISRASGVVAFDELNDVQDTFNREMLRNQPEGFYALMIRQLEAATKAKPNAAHLALAHYNIPIITLTMDGLHRRAGSKHVVELHGGLDRVRCKSCVKEYPFPKSADRFHCPACGETLEPEIAFTDEGILHEGDARRLIHDAQELLIIGTSMKINTVPRVLEWGREAGANLTVINYRSDLAVPTWLAAHFGESGRENHPEFQMR